MNFLAKFLIGAGILAAGFAVAVLLWITRPEPEKNQEEDNLPATNVMIVEKGTHVFRIPSQGIVEADRRTRLAAEVGGKVASVSEKFEVGQRVTTEDVLVQLDDTDYKAGLAAARSALADAEAALANEEARARQAEADWRKLGRGGDPPDLVARKPQLRSARSRVESAGAEVERAAANLARATIRPPYEAVIASTSTELGSYLAPGGPVAEIFATGPYEVRLPLSIDEAGFLRTDASGSPTGGAELSASAAGITRSWGAEIIRSEGEIDRETRSLFVVARVGDEQTEAGVKMRPGLFVRASIEGRRVPGIAAIPFRAFRDLDTVLVVDPDDKLRFRDVTVLHREGEAVYVSGGLEQGERVILTEMPDVVEGMRVDPRLVASPLEEPEEADTSTSASTEP